MGTRHTSSALRSAPSTESVWWGRVRFVLGMAQMAATVVAVVLLFGVGVTPISLTARQKELLQEFESISGKDSGRHNPRAKSWMEKVKEFFES